LFGFFPPGFSSAPAQRRVHPFRRFVLFIAPPDWISRKVQSVQQSSPGNLHPRLRDFRQSMPDKSPPSRTDNTVASCPFSPSPITACAIFVACDSTIREISFRTSAGLSSFLLLLVVLLPDLVFGAALLFAFFLVIAPYQHLLELLKTSPQKHRARLEGAPRREEFLFLTLYI
jgi:hypothetical protein